MVNSIAPVWDGNETWLVLGGGGLFAVFPLAYAVIMPALYPTIIAMLLALVFRGVAFEFRFRAPHAPGRRWWDRAFLAGSDLAAFCQGLSLGGLLQGIRVANRALRRRMVGLADRIHRAVRHRGGDRLRVAGVCWLIWRTEGRLQQRARRYARRLGVAMLAFIVVVSLWTPMLNPRFFNRWFGWPGLLLTSPVPILVALVAWLFWRGLARRHAPHAVPVRAGLVCAVLRRAGDQPVADHRAAVDHDLGCRGARRRQPALPAGRRSGADPDHPDLHRFCLLGVPREGARRRPLPLMRGRLLWFVLLYAAGVATVVAVSFGLRLIIPH